MTIGQPNPRVTTSNIKEHPKPAAWVDGIILLSLVAIVAGIFHFGVQIVKPADPFHATPLVIDLSLGALPVYTLLSLARGFSAYVLSLAFALSYGSIAAKYPRAGRFMIPVLDVLQGIPVLGFLPGLVFAMVALFPGRSLGLELACIVMIFTGQAWNMAFAFYGSLRSVPSDLKEVARLYDLGWWKTFRTLELPFGAIPLVWNSMMSMAGGWFFLIVNESFRLGERDFRLPGVGAYMSAAIDSDNHQAMLYGILAMVVMIVMTDQIVWRPLVAWTNRFKFEDIGEEAPTSWVLDLLGRSRLLHFFEKMVGSARAQIAAQRQLKPLTRLTHPIALQPMQHVRKIGKAAILVTLAGVTLTGAWKIVSLMTGLDAQDWNDLLMSLLWTFLRTTATLLIGALWCLPVGILIGRSQRLSRIFQPIVQVLASFPAPMIYPLATLAILKAGISFNYGCVLLMLLGSQWYILFNVIAGAKAIPGDLVEAARVYGVGRSEVWKRLLIPSVLSALLTGMVTAAGGAWNASIVSELVHYKGQTFLAPGLGSLITKSTEAGDFGKLAAGVLLMSGALIAINRTVWRKLYAIVDRKYAFNR